MEFHRRVRELMVSPQEYPAVDEDSTLRDACIAITSSFEEGREYRHVLVVSREQRLMGILSIFDIMRALVPSFLKPQGLYQGPTQEESSLTLLWQDLLEKKGPAPLSKRVKDIV